MELQKIIKFDDTLLKMQSDNSMYFEGYASLFNKNDAVNDTVLPGAYLKTLAEYGLPKMFVQHRSDNIPVGKWLDAYEDTIGLYVKGELTPNLSIASDVYAAMKHGTMDGMSIGGLLKRDDIINKNEGGMIIKNVSKLLEISIVTFPCDPGARIETLKSLEINSIKEIEDYLRDVGNFSRAEAKLFIAKAKPAFTGQRDVELNKSDIENLVTRLNNISRKLK